MQPKRASLIALVAVVAVLGTKEFAQASRLRGEPNRKEKRRRRRLNETSTEDAESKRSFRTTVKAAAKKSNAFGGKANKQAKTHPIANRMDGLLDTYKDAVGLGIIDKKSSQSAPQTENDNNAGDQIKALVTESITAALSQLGTDHAFHTIRIENEIVGNIYKDIEINGINFSPVITVTNDMHGSLHGNNNAESESGNVVRQNGVADFTDALKNNNNAYSESGDVFRQNGIIGGGGTEAPLSAAKPAKENNNSVDTSTTTVSTNIPEDGDHSELVIHTTIKDNTFVKERQNGLIVTPVISVVNDMSNALYNNNNARSQSGDVKRQNGVADFTGALQMNNNAYSQSGDVVRQNGIISATAISPQEAEALLEALLEFLKDLVFLPKDLVDELFSGIIDVLTSLIDLVGSTSLIGVIQEILSSYEDTLESVEIEGDDAANLFLELTDFLERTNTSDDERVLFAPLLTVLQLVPVETNAAQPDNTEPEFTKSKPKIFSSGKKTTNGSSNSSDSSSSNNKVNRRRLRSGYDNQSGKIAKCPETNMREETSNEVSLSMALASLVLNGNYDETKIFEALFQSNFGFGQFQERVLGMFGGLMDGF